MTREVLTFDMGWPRIAQQIAYVHNWLADPPPDPEFSAQREAMLVTFPSMWGSWLNHLTSPSPMWEVFLPHRATADQIVARMKVMYPNPFGPMREDFVALAQRNRVAVLTDPALLDRLDRIDNCVAALRRAVPPPVPPAAASRLRLVPPSDYYASDHWRDLAARIRKLWNYSCALNIGHRGPIEVHHRTYERLWHESDLDVLPLCEPCHERFHLVLPRPAALDFSEAA